jgi:hypothetical protein
MRLQLEVDQTGDLNPNQFTPKVVLVDEEGNPLTLGDGTPVEVTIDDVEGLTAALAGKAASSHTHTAAQVNVAADATNGISADTLQAVLSALAARVVALEEAAA